MSARTGQSMGALAVASVLIVLVSVTGCATDRGDESGNAPPTASASAGDCTFAGEIVRSRHPITTMVSVKLTNTGPTACVVSGYPDVALVDSNDQVIEDSPSERPAIPAVAFRVEKDDAAYVTLRVAGQNLYPACPLLGAESLRIRLPEANEDIILGVADLAICDRATAGWLVYNMAPTGDNAVE
ncbi:DUF4232 domain-containing protein [Cryobacterium sp. W22_MBD10_FK3]|uniref:DUF4232 domain-containing protein n=1 Tax=Cryobacterium sp. W22_MBD10_FK3 TaxID=3240273 RepID=UPI003F8EE937